MPIDDKYDVIVVGGGNAGLNAAITVADAGAKVLLLEVAPKNQRGGNSRHVRNFRCSHDAPLGVLPESYNHDQFRQDIIQVTEGNTDLNLLDLLVTSSSDCYLWLEKLGVRFQKALSGTLQLNKSNAFYLGGGTALLNTLYAVAETKGIEIIYEAKIKDIVINNKSFESIILNENESDLSIEASSLILASGGFQANKEWLEDIWGAKAKNFIVRGSSYDRGEILKIMMSSDADVVGDEDQCHAIAVDARSPEYDGGIVTRIDCITHGIVINKHGERFYDEGEDIWPKRYAIWGRLIAMQEDQIAYAIIDSKMLNQFVPTVLDPIVGNTIEEVANQISVDSERLNQTLHNFNASISKTHYDHSKLDGCSTENIVPIKSNWARKIDTPPYYAYPLKPGITFTYMGLKVDSQARVQFNGKASENIFAAGEIMAGNILGRGYVAGIGMTIGTVFGRLAGQHAYG
ncbi:MAG: FAD-dependent tricarballylate dehydrogenase TcuA [Gammaproteobacteria bacterium]